MQKLPTSYFIHGSVHAMVLMKLLVGQNRGADVENGQWTESEERRAGCIERPALTYILFFFKGWAKYTVSIKSTSKFSKSQVCSQITVSK